MPFHKPYSYKKKRWEVKNKKKGRERKGNREIKERRKKIKTN